MKKNIPLFAIFLLLTLAWTGWLAYQAFTVADPVVVSGPPLLTASLVVVADVSPGDGEAQARITKVYKDDLETLRRLPEQVRVKLTGKLGSGSYLLALKAVDLPNHLYELAPNPSVGTTSSPSAYEYTESVRLQAERILHLK